MFRQVQSSAKLLLTQKEAVTRYGYSSAWWERQRWLGAGPKYLKLKGKILYPLDSTDQYFLSSGLKQSTSQRSETK